MFLRWTENGPLAFFIVQDAKTLKLKNHFKLQLDLISLCEIKPEDFHLELLTLIPDFRLNSVDGRHHVGHQNGVLHGQGGQTQGFGLVSLKGFGLGEKHMSPLVCIRGWL